MAESPQPIVKPARKLPWYEDPERRQAHLDKLAAGREKASRQKDIEAQQVSQDPTYAYAEDEPNYPDLMRMLRNIRWDRMELSIAEGLMGVLETSRREGIDRLAVRRDRESANRCAYCGDSFPGNRHYQQFVWTDLDTNRLISKLSCAKHECRRQGEAEADRERRRRLAG